MHDDRSSSTPTTTASLLLDFKDLRALLGGDFGSNKELQNEIQRDLWQRLQPASVGAVQRQLLMLESARVAPQVLRRTGAGDLERLHEARPCDGRGYRERSGRNDKLMAIARSLYSTFLLWLLSEMFERASRSRRSSDKPKLVFFFDEAHLLFNDAPKALVEKIEQVVRLIRSKGVGVYFVTQNPIDVPDKVLAQLGNRVQHALRAFTPRDQKAVKRRSRPRSVPESRRSIPRTVITQLGKGEALVSTLEGNGVPSIVQRTLVSPPVARIGPVSEQERRQILANSPFKGKYDEAIDSESAYEILKKRAEQKIQAEQQAQQADTGGMGGLGGILGSILGGGSAPAGKGRGRAPMSTTEVIIKNAASSVARSVGTQLGRAIMRGVLGGLTRR